MTERVQWLDGARGVAIVMIVIHHAVILLAPLGLVHPDYVVARDLLATFPMPLFFLVSGVLSRSALTGSWGHLWRYRLAPLLWLYVVWTLVRFAWFSLVPLATRPDETDLVRLLVSPVWPTSGLWYLHALAVVLVVTKLMAGRVPLAVQLVGATLLSAAFFGPLDSGSIGYEGVAHYLLFFLVGAHFGPRLVGAVQGSTRVAPVLAVVAFLGAVVVVRLFVLQWLPIVPVVLSALAVAAGVLVLRHAPRLTSALRLDVLGRLTLVVYVTHFILLSAMTSLLALVVGPFGGAQPHPVLGVVALPVMVAAAVAGSVGIGTLVRRTPLESIYRLPARRASV
ncbi:acyltransferase family protein [Pseudokineococcus sp. 5B2Z-1]|uniref:acyltransferase family protein n=1 Tax=Pseudokineococcus sp. 5B2Z-1 TaxID=3132744 RepID=UPI0030967E04